MKGINYNMKNVILTGASDGLGKSFAKLCIKNNINVIALCRTKPEYECDFIETDLTVHYEGERKEAVLNNIKLHRFGQAEEVANVILFLLSDLSSYVTGQIIGVDGGMVI